MKLFLIFLGLATAGLLGYKMEPALRHKVTGIAATNLTARAARPIEAARSALDPATLTPEQLPAKVTLKADVQVTDAASEVTLMIPAGNRVKLDRIEGTNAVVSPGTGSYSGMLPVAKTDLMEQLAAAPPPAPSPTSTAVTPVPAPAPESTPVATQPAPAMAPTPEPVPAPAPEPIPAPTATPAPEPTAPAAPVLAPTPAPAAPPTTPAATTEVAPVPTAAPVAAAGDPNAVVKIMQDSVRARQINEFALTQVLTWKAEADETVNGEVFQAGSLTYKAETIFGVKTIQAKALIKDGKVQRWIWPKSGLEIK